MLYLITSLQSSLPFLIYFYFIIYTQSIFLLYNMSHTFRLSEREPNLTLIKNCLAITFINNDCKRCSDERQDSQPQSFSEESSQYNSLSNSDSENCKCICGHLSPLDLFNSFVQENCDCFWNQSLVIGVSGLKYKGFIVPCTLLLTGSDYTFEVIRTAWARRVIKSPQSYTIVNLGKLMHVTFFKYADPIRTFKNSTINFNRQVYTTQVASLPFCFPLTVVITFKVRLNFNQSIQLVLIFFKETLN